MKEAYTEGVKIWVEHPDECFVSGEIKEIKDDGKMLVVRTSENKVRTGCRHRCRAAPRAPFARALRGTWPNDSPHPHILTCNRPATMFTTP